MKILLLGEYSGLFWNLKKGLERNGNEVKLLASGDGWKKIPGADGELYHEGGEPIEKIINYIILPLIKKLDFAQYDAIILIGPLLYHPYVNRMMLRRIQKQNKKIVLMSTGTDYALWKKYKSGFFDYYMFDGSDYMEKLYNESTVRGRAVVKSNKTAVEIARKIIPTLYEYSVGYEGDNRLVDCIPFPLDVNEIEYIPNTVKEKIVFFHGISRAVIKGTDIIIEALKIIEDKYPNDVEIIIQDRVPYSEYICTINRANVLIDQCKAYGYGMNAVIGMAKGKIVMSGARKESMDALGVNECPIVHIQPDVEQIVEQLEYIIRNKDKIEEMGKKSREYAVNIHDCEKVARQYMAVIENM